MSKAEALDSMYLKVIIDGIVVQSGIFITHLFLNKNIISFTGIGLLLTEAFSHESPLLAGWYGISALQHFQPPSFSFVVESSFWGQAFGRHGSTLSSNRFAFWGRVFCRHGSTLSSNRFAFWGQVFSRHGLALI
jgi:hypothetical protein